MVKQGTKQVELAMVNSISFDSTMFHPLDPLSVGEINRVAAIVRSKAGLGEDLLFQTIALHEPPKRDVIDFVRGARITREASVVVLNYKREEIYELDISLETEEILRCEHMPGVQPAFIFDDFNEWESRITHAPVFVEALKKRGIDNPDLVMIDPWPISNFGVEEEHGKRLAVGRCWVRREKAIMVMLDLSRAYLR